MTRINVLRLMVLAASCILSVSGLTAAEPTQREWTVDGVRREALIVRPLSEAIEPAPVVFAFHGHGGSMENAARMFRIHEHWPEAVVVYMQGLKTPGQLTDPEGKLPGWQKAKGDQQDRDLRFFDEVLQFLKQNSRIDEKRIYATGHSNGGGFTYLLWAQRYDVFAAMAPSGSAALRLRSSLKPKPMLHVAGSNDRLVKYEWQLAMIDAVRKLNQCGDSMPWEGTATLYPSEIGAPVVTLVTSSHHKFPPEAPPLIVRFFKENPKP
jgi:polyhydroxybutyrate depolymerase